MTDMMPCQPEPSHGNVLDARGDCCGMPSNPLGYYEFFAGAGLTRLGLAPAWECLWANDIDPKKAEVYTEILGLNISSWGTLPK